MGRCAHFSRGNGQEAVLQGNGFRFALVYFIGSPQHEFLVPPPPGITPIPTSTSPVYVSAAGMTLSA